MTDNTDVDSHDLDLEIAELDARLEMIMPVSHVPDWWIGGGSGTPKTQ